MFCIFKFLTKTKKKKERWGQLLCFEELSYFDQFEGDYEVQFYVKRYR